MKYFISLFLLILPGYASATPETGKEGRIVFEATVKGTHSEVARCMTDALLGHEKYTAQNQKYTVKNDTESSEIQASQESSYGENVYLFTIEIIQRDQGFVQILLRDIEAFKEFVAEATKTCSSS